MADGRDDDSFKAQGNRPAIGLWRWDADGVGAAGTDGTAGGGTAALAQADLDGGEVVVAAGEGEAGTGDGGVGGGDEVENLAGGHGDLVIELR